MLLCGTVYCALHAATLEFVDKILVCDHSNEGYRAVLSCRADYCAAQDVTLESVDEALVHDLSNKNLE